MSFADTTVCCVVGLVAFGFFKDFIIYNEIIIEFASLKILILRPNYSATIFFLPLAAN